MKKLGIIQPARLGDVILCLPIAKYYYDRGYNITWPIFSSYYNIFKEVVDYVNFIPVKDNIYTCVPEAYNVVKDCNKVIDIAATFPGSSCTQRYMDMGDGLGDIRADEFKYIVSDVPINEKWSLDIKRNYKEEERVYNLYVKQDNYVVLNLTSSQGKLNAKFDCGNRQVIEMNESHSPFHWIKIFEKANALILVNSSISNMVEMLNLPNKKYLLPRPDGRLPTLKNKWNTLKI